jgi:CspA family cold shock protein
LPQLEQSWGSFAKAGALTEKFRSVDLPKSNGDQSANRPFNDRGRVDCIFLDLQSQRALVGASRRVSAMTGGKSVMPQQGTIKFFNADKGYGFIKPSDGGRDIFVHITAVEQAGLASLNEGQKISFEVEPDKKGKGPKAVNLNVD